MVDHELLLQRLYLSFGIDGTPFNWIKSYLTDCTQMVILRNTRTPWVWVKLGVPQGSVLGLILYILFTANLPSILARHQTKGHLYAAIIDSTEVTRVKISQLSQCMFPLFFTLKSMKSVILMQWFVFFC